jgi:hypothetical protein
MNFRRMNPLSTKILWTVLGIAACSFLSIGLHAAPPSKAGIAATPPQVKTFDTAQQAANAMILAVKSGDVTALLEIFWPEGKDFVASGDDVPDKQSRAAFPALAEQKMQRRHRPS